MNTSRSRVLLIEDDPRTAAAFCGIVRHLGFEADHAATGEAGRSKLSAHDYQVVVVDVGLPDLNGAELTEQLSKLKPATALILTTGDPKGVPSDHGRRNVAAFLAKPWSIDETRAALAQAFSLNATLVSDGQREYAQPASVLLVDGSARDAVQLVHCLARYPNFSVTHVTTLNEALIRLHQSKFDFVVTELALPDGRGLDALARFQASAEQSALVVCSHLDEDDALVSNALQMGANEFIAKHDMSERTLLRAMRFAKNRKEAELRLRTLAQCDALTGLRNRRSFETAMTQHIARARRTPTSLALLLIDLDGFKSVNDTYGHAAGDAVLQEVATRLRGALRSYDVVARLGGDELAVLLVDAPEDPQAIADRLIETIAAPIRYGEETMAVGASIGIALYPSGGARAEELVATADAALYQVKRSSKGRSQLGTHVTIVPGQLLAQAPRAA